MRILLAFLLAAQVPITLLQHGQVDVLTRGTFTIVAGPIAPKVLEDSEHAGYIARPGCWMRELGQAQHPFNFQNDKASIWLTKYDAVPVGTTLGWECHGLMPKNEREICFETTRNFADIRRCYQIWPNKEGAQ